MKNVTSNNGAVFDYVVPPILMEEKTEWSAIKYKDKVYSGLEHYLILTEIADEHGKTPDEIAAELGHSPEVYAFVTNRGRLIQSEEMHRLGWVPGSESDYAAWERDEAEADELLANIKVSTHNRSEVLKRAFDKLGEPRAGVEQRLKLAEPPAFDVAPLKMEEAPDEEKTQESAIIYKGKVYSEDRHAHALDMIAYEHGTTPDAILDELDDPLMLCDKYVTNKGRVISRVEMYHMGWVPGSRSDYATLEHISSPELTPLRQQRAQEIEAEHKRAFAERPKIDVAPLQMEMASDKLILLPITQNENELFAEMHAAHDAWLETHERYKAGELKITHKEAMGLHGTHAQAQEDRRNVLIDMAQQRGDTEAALDYKSFGHTTCPGDCHAQGLPNGSLGHCDPAEQTQPLPMSEEEKSLLAEREAGHDSAAIDRAYDQWKDGKMPTDQYNQLFHAARKKNSDRSARLRELALQRNDQEAYKKYCLLGDIGKCPGNCHEQGLAEGSLGNCNPVPQRTEQEKVPILANETRRQREDDRRRDIFTHLQRQEPIQKKPELAERDPLTNITSMPIDPQGDHGKQNKNELAIQPMTAEEDGLKVELHEAHVDQRAAQSKDRARFEAAKDRQRALVPQLVAMANARGDEKAAAEYQGSLGGLESWCPSDCEKQGLEHGSHGHCTPTRQNQSQTQPQHQPQPRPVPQPMPQSTPQPVPRPAPVTQPQPASEPIGNWAPGEIRPATAEERMLGYEAVAVGQALDSVRGGGGLSAVPTNPAEMQSFYDYHTARQEERQQQLIKMAEQRGDLVKVSEYEKRQQVIPDEKAGEHKQTFEENKPAQKEEAKGGNPSSSSNASTKTADTGNADNFESNDQEPTQTNSGCISTCPTTALLGALSSPSNAGNGNNEQKGDKPPDKPKPLNLIFDKKPPPQEQEQQQNYAMRH